MKVCKLKDTDFHVLVLIESKPISGRTEKTLNLCLDANKHYLALPDSDLVYVTDIEVDEETLLIDGPKDTKRKNRKKKSN